uniref:Uncharacterized protein n=1 Tax=Romanomermis culicivorax TaxID=13658 RepID=A0A915KPR2_ROMCU
MDADKTHEGAVALNLTVRCPEKSAEIKKRFDENFGTVLSHRISDDIVNELLICLPYKPPNMSDFNILVQDRLSKLHDYLSLICNNSSATREKEEYKKKIVQNDSPQTLKCGVQEIMDKIVKI